MKSFVVVVVCFYSVPLNSIDLIALCVDLLLIPDLGTLYLVVVQSLSRVQLFATPWTAARQASLSLSPRVCSNSCPLNW